MKFRRGPLHFSFRLLLSSEIILVYCDRHAVRFCFFPCAGSFKILQLESVSPFRVHTSKMSDPIFKTPLPLTRFVNGGTKSAIPSKTVLQKEVKSASAPLIKQCENGCGNAAEIFCPTCDMKVHYLILAHVRIFLFVNIGLLGLFCDGSSHAQVQLARDARSRR